MNCMKPERSRSATSATTRTLGVAIELDNLQAVHEQTKRRVKVMEAALRMALTRCDAPVCATVPGYCRACEQIHAALAPTAPSTEEKPK